MGTKAETIRVSARPGGLTLWTATVSALAAAALIVSVVALTVAGHDRAATGVAGNGIHEATTQTHSNAWAGMDLAALQEAGFTGRLGGSTADTAGYRTAWTGVEVKALQEAGFTGRLGGSTP